jgi:hypothetical protein
MANKAVLLDLGVFIADNNVRRNVASLRVNAQSVNGEVRQLVDLDKSQQAGYRGYQPR